MNTSRFPVRFSFFFLFPPASSYIDHTNNHCSNMRCYWYMVLRFLIVMFVSLVGSSLLGLGLFLVMYLVIKL